MNKTPKLIQFGRGGDSIEYGGGCHESGYGTPEHPHAVKLDHVPDGCPVIDKRPALNTREGFAWVFRGPIVNVDLAPASIERCPELADNPMARAMMHDAPNGNGFGQLALLHMAHTTTSKAPSPLDSVDIQTYIEGWRAVSARIGQVIAGKIVWED